MVSNTAAESEEQDEAGEGRDRLWAQAVTEQIRSHLLLWSMNNHTQLYCSCKDNIDKDPYIQDPNPICQHRKN